MRSLILNLSCLLIAALYGMPAHAEARPDHCGQSRAALGRALNIHLAHRIDTWNTRSAGIINPVDPLQLADDFIDGVAATLAVTPHREVAVVYSQSADGLCAHVLTEAGLVGASSRPGQSSDALMRAQLDLRRALDVEGRSRGRAPERRDGARNEKPPSLAETLRNAVGLTGRPRAAGSGRPWSDAAATLAHLLMLDDLDPFLATADEVLVVPMYDIGTVPFALLPSGDGLLLDRAPVTLVPNILSASGEDFTDTVTVKRSMEPFLFAPGWSNAVVVGDPEVADDPDWSFPPLPGARREALRAAQVLGAQAPLIGAGATIDAVWERVRAEPDIIYLAAHAVASTDDPLKGSFIALADGRLKAGDMLGTWLSSHPLVVLSACQSGLGRTQAGGTVGLSYLFGLAGASAVVSTLWSVDDAATQALMADFLGALNRERPADALWHAMQNARRRNPDDPVLWAGLAYVGSVSTFQAD